MVTPETGKAWTSGEIDDLTLALRRRNVFTLISQDQLDTAITKYLKSHAHLLADLAETANGTAVPGPPGKSFLTGQGPPDSGVGNSGDTYLDLTTGDVYTKA